MPIFFTKSNRKWWGSKCGFFLVCFRCIFRFINNVISETITKITEHNISINVNNTSTSIKVITSYQQLKLAYLKTTANSSKNWHITYVALIYKWWVKWKMTLKSIFFFSSVILLLKERWIWILKIAKQKII